MSHPFQKLHSRGFQLRVSNSSMRPRNHLASSIQQPIGRHCRHWFSGRPLKPLKQSGRTWSNPWWPRPLRRVHLWHLGQGWASYVHTNPAYFWRGLWFPLWVSEHRVYSQRWSIPDIFPQKRWNMAININHMILEDNIFCTVNVRATPPVRPHNFLGILKEYKFRPPLNFTFNWEDQQGY